MPLPAMLTRCHFAPPPSDAADARFRFRFTPLLMLIFRCPDFHAPAAASAISLATLARRFQLMRDVTRSAMLRY